MTIPGDRHRHTDSTAQVRRAGLVVRVSTERQAANDEGSLKNQKQCLRQHMDYKRQSAGEMWEEVELYELRAVSGKDAVRNPEFERLFADIAAGRVNTVLCTALDRISRTVKDLLHFFEMLDDRGVEFVCLKQNFDTTSPHGKFSITIMAAMAQLEREQTAERTRDSAIARSKRGLRNGGQILGYDTDPDRKGHLIVNESEAAIVDFAFDTYLECGSFAETARTLKRCGFRTKSYTSRRGRYHPGSAFGLTSVQTILKNRVYIAKQTVPHDGPECRRDRELVDAVWDPIVDEHKFWRVQDLIEGNSRSNRNGAKPVRHEYVLSGIAYCGRCRSRLQGRSGTGQNGVKYFYYACGKKECEIRVRSAEAEDAVIGRLKTLAQRPDVMSALVEKTNSRIQRAIPALKNRKRAIKMKLDDGQGKATKIITEFSSNGPGQTRELVDETLREIAGQRAELKAGLDEVDRQIDASGRATVNEQSLTVALSDFSTVYGSLRPYERKELVKLIVHRLEISDREIALEVYGIPSMNIRGIEASRGPSRFVPPMRLLGQDLNLQQYG